MNFWGISEALKELLRHGKYTVYSPSEDRPELVSIFYLDGDLICYADPEKLEENPAIIEEHLSRVRKLVLDLRLPLRFLERLLAILIPVISFFGMFQWKGELIWKSIIFLVLTVFSYFTKSAMAKAVIKLISLRLRKDLGLF